MKRLLLVKGRKLFLAIMASTGILAGVFATNSTAAVTAGSVDTVGIKAVDYNSLAHISGAVGKKHIVEVVGKKMKVCDKRGKTCTEDDVANRFMNYINQTCYMSDTTKHGAAVAYDSLADRFVIVLAVQNPNNNPKHALCVAVSQTGNPQGSYYYYYVPMDFPSTDPDYTAGISIARPYLGVWPDGYYVTFRFMHRVFVLDRAGMLNNTSSKYQSVKLPWKGGFVPSHLTGTSAPASGTPNYLFSFYKPEHDHDEGGHNHDEGGAVAVFEGIRAYAFKVDWSNSANTNINTYYNLPITDHAYPLCPNYPGQFCVTQPSARQSEEGSYTFGADAGAPAGPVNYRKIGTQQSFLLSHSIDMDRNGYGWDPSLDPDGGYTSDLLHAGVKWYELRLSGSTPSIYQTGDYSPSTPHYWSGAMAMNKNGDIGMAYNVSSISVYPEIRATGRKASDTSGSLTQGETTLETSGNVIDHTSQYNVMAWAAPAMVIDPDGCTFYSFGMYTYAGLWATRMNNSWLPDCYTNLALNKTVSVSSTESSTYAGSKAVDGSNSSRWSSTHGSDPQWIRIDLGSSRTFHQVVLRWEAAYATVFKIQTSDNGSTWTTIYSTTSGTGGTQTLNITGTGRYVRMYGTQRATQYGYSLYEFQIYGS